MVARRGRPLGTVRRCSLSRGAGLSSSSSLAHILDRDSVGMVAYHASAGAPQIDDLSHLRTNGRSQGYAVERDIEHIAGNMLAIGPGDAAADQSRQAGMFAHLGDAGDAIGGEGFDHVLEP